MFHRQWLIDPHWMKSAIAALRADQRPAAKRGASSGNRQKSVGVLPLVGPLAPRDDFFLAFFGGTSMLEWGAAFDAMVADPSVAAIVIPIDSPGGTVTGTPELADKVYRARSVKPIVAVTDSGMVASAALWIGTAATKLYLSRSSESGSVGVYQLLVDETRALESKGIKVEVIKATGSPHKAEGASFLPTTDDERAHEQRMVDRSMDAFVGALARNRRTSAEHILKHYGKGRLLRADDAVRVGMADGIADLDMVLYQTVRGSLPDGTRMQSSRGPEPGWRASLETERLRSRLRQRGILNN